MNAMQEGRSMGDGDFYTIQEYEKMANKFHNEWLDKHHKGEEFSYDALEADYWKIIRNSHVESPAVEYGNDLSTLEYASGFMKRMVFY
jgi:hypothetical protein